jgi:hypothetical protein
MPGAPLAAEKMAEEKPGQDHITQSRYNHYLQESLEAVCAAETSPHIAAMELHH